MNLHWYHFSRVVFLLAIFISCDGAGVGTVVNKPSLPTSNLFPDIDAYVSLTALLGDDSSESALVKSGHSLNLSDSAAFERIYNNGVFLDRTEDVRNVFIQLRDLGAAVAEIAQEAELDETLQVFNLTTEPKLFFEVSSLWQVEMQREPSDDTFSRSDFRNEDSLLYGTYIVQTNASLEAVKGATFYTRQDLIVSNTGNEKKVVLFAFDFTDTSKALIVMRIDRYLPATEVNIVYQLHVQYNAESGVGIGEYLEINTASPLRELSDIGVRFSWNESTGLTCLVQAPDYAAGSLDPRGPTYEFVSSGTDVPDESDVAEGVCTIATPHSGGHVFTTEDLVLRYEDTDPFGGTAAEYYNADFLLDDFDVTTSLDAWLDASGLD